jgi:signal transduction histidine kinase
MFTCGNTACFYLYTLNQLIGEPQYFQPVPTPGIVIYMIKFNSSMFIIFYRIILYQLSIMVLKIIAVSSPLFLVCYFSCVSHGWHYSAVFLLSSFLLMPKLLKKEEIDFFQIKIATYQLLSISVELALMSFIGWYMLP